MKLDIENKNGITLGTLITFDNKYQDNLLLGIKSGNEIVKQNLHIENKKCQFKIPSSVTLDRDISCTVVDTNNDKFEPILWGSSSSTKQSENNIIQSLKKMVTKIQTTKQTNLQQVDSKSKNKPQETIKIETLPPTQKVNEPYSQISLEPEQISFEDIAIASTANTAESLFESTEEELENTIDTALNNSHNFYNMIADQIDELFDIYPRETNLEKLIDNSVWCRIDTEFDNKYYVVGIIKEYNDIKYICYGVPGNYNIEPPIEMRNYSQWLPTDTTDPYNSGYWVMYQDSDTGENIFIN